MEKLMIFEEYLSWEWAGLIKRVMKRKMKEQGLSWIFGMVLIMMDSLREYDNSKKVWVLKRKVDIS